jgi:hypothetical protein
MRMTSMTRRRFLRDLGVSAATVPLLVGLDSLYARAAGPVPKKRFIFMYSPNGTFYYNWRLRVQGPVTDISNGAALAAPNSILNPLKANAKKLLVLDRLSWTSSRTMYQNAAASPDHIEHPGGHQKGMGSLLTGQVLIGGNGNAGDAGLANGVSVDQVLATQLFADKTKFPSLEVGVQVTDDARSTVDRYVDKRVSYDGAAKPRAPANDPFALFTTVFGTPSTGTGPNLRAFLDKSVLDAALQDFNRLKPKLSLADQHLLDQHATSVRGIETQLATVVNCGMAMPPTAPAGINISDPAATHKWAMTLANFPTVGTLMTDIIVQAVACGLTNVVTFMWANSENDLQYHWIPTIDYAKTSSGHHGMSHARDPYLVDIDQWYAARFNDLITKLDAIPESGATGTVLDNSVLMWSSCLGDGAAHLSNNVPVVLAGSNGGYFKTGRNIQFNDVYTPAQWAGDPLGSAAGQALTDAVDAVRSGDQKKIGTPDLSNNDLMVSILNSFGMQTNTFGDARFCHGPLPNLTG